MDLRKEQTKTKMSERVCSICGKQNEPWRGRIAHGYGNNAAPFVGRCCSDCKMRYVVPARMGSLPEPIKQGIEDRQKAS
jgi:hypothetical protein